MTPKLEFASAYDKELKMWREKNISKNTEKIPNYM